MLVVQRALIRIIIRRGKVFFVFQRILNGTHNNFEWHERRLGLFRCGSLQRSPRTLIGWEGLTPTLQEPHPVLGLSGSELRPCGHGPTRRLGGAEFVLGIHHRLHTSKAALTHKHGTTYVMLRYEELAHECTVHRWFTTLQTCIKIRALLVLGLPVFFTCASNYVHSHALTYMFVRGWAGYSISLQGFVIVQT